MSFTLELAKKILENSSNSVSKAIYCINSHYDFNKDGIETEINEFSAAPEYGAGPSQSRRANELCNASRGSDPI